MARHDWVWNCVVACVVFAAAGNCAWGQLGGVPETAAASSAATPCYCVGETASASIKKIKGALKAPLHSPGLDFAETPLEEVVAFVQDEYGIPIMIDTPELDDVGIGPSEQISVNLRNITLRSALRLMLSPLDLTYIIQDEVLIITTPEKAETILITCIYDVRDIVGSSKDERRQLMEAMTKCIAMQNWGTNKDGQAELRVIHPGFLVVSQTQAGHDQIASFLRGVKELRDGKSANTEPAKPTPKKAAENPNEAAAEEDPFSE